VPRKPCERHIPQEEEEVAGEGVVKLVKKGNTQRKDRGKSRWEKNQGISQTR